MERSRFDLGWLRARGPAVIALVLLASSTAAHAQGIRFGASFGRGSSSRAEPQKQAEPAESSDAKTKREIEKARVAKDTARLVALEGDAKGNTELEQQLNAAFFELGDFDHLADRLEDHGSTDITTERCLKGCSGLTALEKQFGRAPVVAMAKQLLKTHKFGYPSEDAFAQVVAYLMQANETAGICDASARFLLEPGMTYPTSQAMVKLNCSVADSALIHLMKDDDWRNRSWGAWMAGQLHHKALLKQVTRLAQGDPFVDDGFRYPVRAAAQLAVIKLED